jgi:hypothetical protein
MGEGQEGRATVHQDSGRFKHVRNKIEFIYLILVPHGTVFALSKIWYGRYIPMWYRYSEYRS